MPEVNLKEIQSAIKDSLDTYTYNSEEILENDVYPLIERGYTSCLEYC